MSEHTGGGPLDGPRDDATENVGSRGPSVPPENESALTGPPPTEPRGDVPPEPGAFGAPPPTAPPAPVLVEPRRRPVAYVAVALGLLGMIGGAIFFASSLGNNEGGASTPVAAVQQMFDALNDQDALGAMETLLPSERDLFRDSIQAITKELSRLGVLRSDLNLGSLNGIQLDFTGLKFTSQSVAPTVSVVSATAGRVSYRLDPNGALGDFVRGLLPAEAKRVTQGTDDITPADEVRFATVKDGDNWYVSVWYSIAESAREDAGAAAPQFGAGVPGRGAATPEAAVEDFMRAVFDLNVRRMIELTPPEEMRALHDYAPLFLQVAEAGAAEARKAFTAQIRSLKASARTTGDRATVKIDDFTFGLEIPEVGIKADYDGTCFTLQGEIFGSGGPQRQCGTGGIPGLGLPNMPTPDIGFRVVQEGGQWYVSPVGTMFDAFLGTLKVLDRSHLDAIKALVESFGG